MSKDKAINVLMIGSSLEVKGGMSSVIRQLLEHEWSSKINMNFVGTHTSGSFIKRILFFAKGYITILYYFVSGKKIDIIHMHMSYKGSFLRKYYVHKLCKLFKRKDVIHLHGSEFEEFYYDSKPNIKMKIKKILKESDRIIVLGKKWDQIILKIEPSAKTSVLCNTVNIPNESVKWDDNKFEILYLGVLIKRKGLSDLINAMDMLNSEGFIDIYNIRLIIAGSGEEEENLKKQSKDLGLDKYIEFSGWIDKNKKDELLRGKQVLVLPSYNEGLPISILEALSYGMPVISTNVGSIDEAVIDCKNGYLIQPGSPHSIVDSIKKISSSKKNWEVMSQESKKMAIEKFNEHMYFKSIEKLYDDLA